MNFDQFEEVSNTHSRKGGYKLNKEQSYEDMKYRKSPKKVVNKEGVESTELEGRFFVANARMKEWGIEGGANGLSQFTNNATGETVICIVDQKVGKLIKEAKKSKVGKKPSNFKSANLEAAFEKAGLINPALVKENQFLKLTLAAENVTIKGVPCLKVFSVSKGVAKPVVVKEEKATIADAPVSETPAPTAAPVAATGAPKGEWD